MARVKSIVLRFEFPESVTKIEDAREYVHQLLEMSLKPLDEEYGKRWYFEVRPNIQIKTGFPGGDLTVTIHLKKGDYEERVTEVFKASWKRIVGR